MKPLPTLTTLLALSAGLVLSACGSSNSRNPLITEPPPPPPAALTLNGNVFDGPVSGGTIYVFDSNSISTALAAADQAEDRTQALNDAAPIVTLARAPDSGPAYSIEVSGESADQALFLVFDANGSSDGSFGGSSLHLLSMTAGVSAGGNGVANITPHTSLITRIVQQQLDPDGDGTAIAQADIENALTEAQSNVLNALGAGASGDEFYGEGSSPFSSEDEDALVSASVFVATLMRSAAAVADTSESDTLTILAADLSDGELDGNPGALFDLSEDQQEALADLEDLLTHGTRIASTANMPSCTNSARALFTACGYEVLDEAFIDSAKCVDTSNESAAESCLASVERDQEDAMEECGDVFEARSELCTVLNDAIYQPDFGANFASNFVDPRNIGGTVTPNPYFPMVNGNEWVYSGTFEEDGETITEEIRISVSDKVKSVDGILCLVVRDVVTKNGELVEDTDDWFAQDLQGNIWYCGEEVKDYETFEDDQPPLPELIAIDGSFKAGRDGDKAGIQLPFTPTPGEIFRQEVSLANAEDVIEILAIDASATVPAVTCTNTCLQTRDFSPLDPGVEEHKYYEPGVGKILEINLETGDRFELVEFNQMP